MWRLQCDIKHRNRCSFLLPQIQEENTKSAQEIETLESRIVPLQEEVRLCSRDMLVHTSIILELNHFPRTWTTLTLVCPACVQLKLLEGQFKGVQSDVDTGRQRMDDIQHQMQDFSDQGELRLCSPLWPPDAPRIARRSFSFDDVSRHEPTLGECMSALCSVLAAHAIKPQNETVIKKARKLERKIDKLKHEVLSNLQY